MVSRDYSLLGPDAERAQASGLITPDWYQTPLDRREIKALMQRSDQPALRDTLLLFALMLVFAACGIALWPSFWSLPFWLAYGVLYGSAMDSRWHECGHGTAFKTRRLNTFVYQIACFCMIRDPHCWKFSHARHHSDTIIVGRDPEISIMRPTFIAKLIANLFGLVDAWDGVKRTLLHAGGHILDDEADYVPESSYPAIIRTARIWLAIYALMIASVIAWQSWIPLLLIGLPRLYGCWHMVLCGWLQHGGLEFDVVISGVGSVPNAELADAAGVAVSNGIVVDSSFRTSSANIFAAGDCCNFQWRGRGVRLESWKAAQDQGTHVAACLLGANSDYTGIPWFWSGQFDLTLNVTGLFEPAGAIHHRETTDERCIVFQCEAGGQLSAAAGIGHGNAVSRELRIFEKLIARQTEVEPRELIDSSLDLRQLLKAA